MVKIVPQRSQLIGLIVRRVVVPDPVGSGTFWLMEPRNNLFGFELFPQHRSKVFAIFLILKGQITYIIAKHSFKSMLHHYFVH